jgi:hypothetical protein
VTWVTCDVLARLPYLVSLTGNTTLTSDAQQKYSSHFSWQPLLESMQKDVKLFLAAMIPIHGDIDATGLPEALDLLRAY